MSPAQVDDVVTQPRNFLFGWAGKQLVALALEAVQSVALSAELLELPGAPPPLIGALQFGRELVGVVDLARALGVEARLPYAQRRLVHVVAAPWPLALCCDLADEVITVAATEVWSVPGAAAHAAVSALVRNGDQVAAFIEPAALLDQAAAAALERALAQFRDRRPQ